MGIIYISYRRSDSFEFSKRMASELKAYFGTNAVFFDQTTIQAGEKWPQKIQYLLDVTNVVLVVIGSRWLQAKEEKSGRRRIDLKDDWVRREILTALRRKKGGEQLDILPVFFGNTPTLEVEDLDEELGEVAYFQAVKLPDTGSYHDFDELKDRLIRQCRFRPRVLPPVNTPRFGRIPLQLSEEEEAAFRAEFKEWEIVETEDPLVPGGSRRELYRVYEFPTFDLAFQFMNEVAKRGIKPRNHHPRWQNTFNRVEVWLTTFNINYRPSARDLRLAQVFEEVWEEFRSNMA